MKTFPVPTRVWINCPSALQPLHHLHATTCIAYTIGGETRIYFCNGRVTSMIADPIYLETDNSQADVFKLNTTREEHLAFCSMLEALMNLENDDGHIPKHAWDIIQRAIKKALPNYIIKS